MTLAETTILPLAWGRVEKNRDRCMPFAQASVELHLYGVATIHRMEIKKTVR